MKNQETIAETKPVVEKSRQIMQATLNKTTDSSSNRQDNIDVRLKDCPNPFLNIVLTVS